MRRARRAIAGLFACVVGVAAAATLFAQEPVGNLHDLIGVRGRHGDNQIRERGYSFVRTMEQGANGFSYWTESRSGRCVSVRSAKNRYAAFSYVPDAECGGGSAQVGYGGGASGDSGNYGVTLHRGLNFTGVSENFKSDMPNLRGSRIGDDQAASVSVSHGCRARLYQQPNYQGAYVEVTSGIGDLRGWKAGVDSVTSLRVRCDGEAWSDDQDEWVAGASSDSGGVTLHRDLKFTGVNEAFTSDVPDLRGSQIGDDEATSVSISQGCRARLYQHLNYEGAYTEVSSSMTDLRGSKVGDDSATSLQVRCDGWGWNDDRDDERGISASSVSRGVTLHRDLNFTGVSEAFTSDVPDLRNSRIGDDQATSVSVSRGCQARLYQHLNYEGAYTEVSSSMDALRGSKVGDDSVTSIKVRCDTLTRSKTGSGQ